MITQILNRLEVLAGLEDNKLENEKVEVETARGISRNTWEDMNQREKKKYVDGHPNSIYYYEFYSKQAKLNLKKIKGQIKELKGLQGKYKSAKKQNEIQAQIDKLKKKGKKLQDFVKGLDGKFNTKEVKSTKPISTIKPVKDTPIKTLDPVLENKVKDVEDKLKKGTYKIKFKKIDGSIREITGSMEDKYLKQMNFSSTPTIHKKNPSVVPFIDIDSDPPQFKSFRIENLLSMDNLNTIDNKQNNQPLKGKVFCMTGFRDAKLKKEIEDKGGIVKDSFTKDVNVLLSNISNSTKTELAKKRGIPVIKHSDIGNYLKKVGAENIEVEEKKEKSEVKKHKSKQYEYTSYEDIKDYLSEIDPYIEFEIDKDGYVDLDNVPMSCFDLLTDDPKIKIGNMVGNYRDRARGYIGGKKKKKKGAVARGATM